MNMLLQLRDPIIDGDGAPRRQIVADFNVDSDEYVTAKTIFGDLAIDRKDVSAVLFLAPDFDRQSLQDSPHILVLN